VCDDQVSLSDGDGGAAAVPLCVEGVSVRLGSVGLQE
jgi:hypothetical protein